MTHNNRLFFFLTPPLPATSSTQLLQSQPVLAKFNNFLARKTGVKPTQVIVIAQEKRHIFLFCYLYIFFEKGDENVIGKKWKITMVWLPASPPETRKQKKKH